jgi:hypothetical protein
MDKEKREEDRNYGVRSKNRLIRIRKRRERSKLIVNRVKKKKKKKRVKRSKGVCESYREWEKVYEEDYKHYPSR